MKVLHLTRHWNIGGAGTAIAEIHKELLRHGVDSHGRFESASLESSDESQPLDNRLLPWRYQKSSLSRYSRIAQRYWNRRLNDKQTSQGWTTIFSDKTDGRRLVLDRTMKTAEVVHCNWIAQSFSLPWLLSALSQASFVFRFTDSYHLTGGCHWPGDCSRWLQECRQCPRLAHRTSKRHVRKSRRAIERLAAFLANRSHIVAQSKWMAKRIARHPFWSSLPCRVIINGINPEIFYPEDRPLQSDGRRLGLIIHRPGDKRCQTDELIERLLPHLGPERQLVVVQFSGTQKDLGPHVQHLGRCTAIELAAEFRRVDCLLFPHLDDNCPNTVLQSLGCGTPVSVLNDGGTPELIHPGRTGWINESLDQMVQEFVQTKSTPQIGRAQIAKSVSTWSEASKTYAEVFNTAAANFGERSVRPAC